MTNENLIKHMVREGVVSSQNTSDGTVRVKYPDTGVLSGWLKVLQHGSMAISIAPDGEHTHVISDTYSGGGSASTIPSHSHTGSVTGGWMPSINARVLVLCIPIFNGDGFVLGGL